MAAESITNEMLKNWEDENALNDYDQMLTATMISIGR